MGAADVDLVRPCAGFWRGGWALWLYVTGRGEDALLVALVTMGVTRFLAGGWYYKR